MVRWQGRSGEYDAYIGDELVGAVWRVVRGVWQARWRGHRPAHDFTTLTEAQTWIERCASNEAFLAR